MYLLAPFILQNFKKILRANPELWGCAIFGSKIPQFVLNKIFWYKPLLLLSSTYWPFSLCKILKKFLQPIQSYEDTSFLCPKWLIWHKQKKFLKKILKIIFIYILAPFILQNLKKFLEPIQSYEDVPFSVPKYPNLSWTKIFGTKHYHFHLPIGLFQWRKFLKNSYNESRIMRMHHFWTQNGPFAPNKKFFLKKIINIIFIYLLAPFIVQNFKKKSYSGSRVMRMHQFWAQNSPFAQMRFFSENLFLSFKPIYFSKTKVRYSSINEILTIKEYWNFIGWEQFLAITWEPDFSQACSFRRINHNELSFYTNFRQN